jgi:small subunit ribosomal protein S10
MNQKIRIKLKSYDASLIDNSATRIVKAVKLAGGIVDGPIPLPTKKEYYTVLTSPHVYKTAREQFQLFTHKRLIDVYANNAKPINALMKLELPSGIDVEIKV